MNSILSYPRKKYIRGCSELFARKAKIYLKTCEQDRLYKLVVGALDMLFLYLLSFTFENSDISYSLRDFCNSYRIRNEISQFLYLVVVQKPHRLSKQQRISFDSKSLVFKLMRIWIGQHFYWQIAQITCFSWQYQQVRV